MSIKVLIVDDHPLIRDALTDLFADTPDIDVVGQCSDGCEVLDAVARARPDVVLMDLQMPTMDGIEATRQLLAVHPAIRVVVLTGALTPATACAARALGAAGYLLKEEDPAQLPDRVRSVAAGGTAWSPAALQVIDTGWNSLVDGASGGSSSPYVQEAPQQYR